PDDWGPLDQCIARLESYDFIVLTSANALKFLAERLVERRVDGVKALSKCRLCVIGSATANAASDLGLTPFLIPEAADAESLLESIRQRLGGDAAIAEKTFLIPRSSIAREVLTQGLSELGATVDAVDAYKTVVPTADPALLERLSEKAIDAITFTSPSTVNNFFLILGRDQALEALRGALVACIGPVTAKAAEEIGLQNVFCPSSYDTESLVAEILNRL